MKFNDIKQLLTHAPELARLDGASRSFLFWRSEEQVLAAGVVIYVEGAKLDDTFCLLLEGQLIVEKAGALLGEISQGQIFGEMAYFSPRHERYASVRVGSPQAAVLRIQLTAAEMSLPGLAELRRYLGLQAWDRFVTDAESQAE